MDHNLQIEDFVLQIKGQISRGIQCLIQCSIELVKM